MNEEEIKKKKKSVFSNKNFTLSFLGALVSNVGSLFYSFAVSFYILKITDNNALIQGLYLAVGGIVFCVVTLFGGVISDRFNKAKIMYICDYLKGALILLFTILLMTVITSVTAKVAALFVVTIIGNAIAGIFTPASNAILPQIVEEDMYQQAQSYFSILNSFQSIVGIILAGVLYTLVPINILFLIVGACYVLSGISEMFIKYESNYEKRDEKLTMNAVLGDIKEGVKYVVSMKAILSLILCILFVNFFFSPIFDNFAPYFIATDIAASDYMFKEYLEPEMWQSFFSVAVGVGSLIMGIIMSNAEQKEKYSKTIRWGVVITCLVTSIMPIVYILFINNVISINASLVSIIIVLLAIGMLLVVINVSTSTAMLKIVDKDKIGKVSSVGSIGSQGLIPLSMFLGGVALTYIGSAGLLIVCASGLIITALVLFFNKSIKEL